MLITPTSFLFLCCLFLYCGLQEVRAQAGSPHATAVNVRAYGAKGDGKALDSPAINKAIDAASANGGGTVFFPAGTYRSFSIRLKSNITLYFDQGSILLGASPDEGDGRYTRRSRTPGTRTKALVIRTGITA